MGGKINTKSIPIICSFCKKEITEEQQKGGFFAEDPKAWDWVRGFYKAGAKHRQCGFKGIVSEWIENGVKISLAGDAEK